MHNSWIIPNIQKASFCLILCLISPLNTYTYAGVEPASSDEQIPLLPREFTRSDTYSSSAFESHVFDRSEIETNLSTKENITRPLPTTQKKRIRVLALAGGGVRGIMEAWIAQQIEEQTGRPISDIFHLIGGTSAGGTLATLLTEPESPDSSKPKYSAAFIVDTLLDRSHELFTYRWSSFFGFFGAKYRTDIYRNVFTDYLGEQTTDKTTAPTMVLAYNTISQQLESIKSWEGSIFRKTDAILATSAAETFFDAAHITPISTSRQAKGISQRTSQPRSPLPLLFTDGGTAANDPTLCLLMEALELYPDADEIELVSIGSGHYDRPIQREEITNAGLFTWATHFPRIVMSGQRSKDQKVLNTLFTERHDKHFRIKGDYSFWTPKIERINNKLDNPDRQNLLTLITAADAHIKSRQEEFDQLIARLKIAKDVYSS